MSALRILAIRLGAMGDIIHALPAVASLKQSFPGCRLAWAVERRWLPLLERNPYVDETIVVDRGRLSHWLCLRRRLMERRFDVAVDFQGLVKSAAVALLSRAERIYGLHRSAAREPVASLVYSHTCQPRSTHMIDRHLELVAVAGAGAIRRTFPIPEGEPEGELPQTPFVLASPDAGWRAKQWPDEYWAELARRIRDAGCVLVINGSRSIEVPGAVPHVSGISGLIWATRRARAVIGLDSGPLHLAGALAKPGVAIFGPTDPARNGPPGDSLLVLREPNARTTYKRNDAVDDTMRAITPEQVWEALAPMLDR